MTDQVKDICDEVVTLISGYYPLAFESIERVRNPRYDEDSLASVRCYVVGAGVTNQNVARGVRQDTYTVLVFIVGRVAAPTGTDVDDLVELTLEVARKFEQVKLPISCAKERGISVTLYDADGLQTQNKYESLITVTFDGGPRSV